MDSRHKYFRNQKYKQKLMAKYYQGYNRSYPSNIVFISKDKATNINYPDIYFDKSHGRYVYWQKPDVPYSIQEKKYSLNKKWLRTSLNRRLRHVSYDENIDHGRYRKLYEYWWVIY